MVQWLSEGMRREGLIWENGPNVSVNANSSDSHYEPTAEKSSPIREGDFLLIDIWGKQDKPGGDFLRHYADEPRRDWPQSQANANS